MKLIKNCVSVGCIVALSAIGVWAIGVTVAIGYIIFKITGASYGY